MRLRFDYHRDWDPEYPLDPEAASVLTFLDGVAGHRRLKNVGDDVVLIDAYGVVCADVPVNGGAGFYLQAGDGWDRLLWTA